MAKPVQACRVILPALVVLFLATRTASAQVSESLCDASFQDCRQTILDLIAAETQQVDVAYWFMQDSRYSQALISRFQAGVRVRVIMDLRASPLYSGNQTIIDSMASSGIPLRDKNAGGINHMKMMQFAGQKTVAFSDGNFSPYFLTPADPYVNYIDAVLYTTNDPAVVGSFQTRFDDLWTDATDYSDYTNVVQPTTRSYPTVVPHEVPGHSSRNAARRHDYPGPLRMDLRQNALVRVA